jgi:hypothetical protein
MTNINHKILLGAAITLASLQQASAVPFAPADARAMGMGGTGVSSAEIASTVQFNPALLATTRADDHFGLKIPQFSISVADDGGFIDEAEDFDEESDLDNSGQGRTNIDLLGDLLDETVNTDGQGLKLIATALAKIEDSDDIVGARNDLNTAFPQIDGKLFDSTGDTPQLGLFAGAIANDLDDLNNKALRINGGLNVAGAVPSEKFSMAIHAGGQVTFSGQVLVNPQDSNLLRNYTNATSAYLDLVNDLRVALNDTDLVAADAATTAIRNFSYGTGAGEGGTAIFENGELVANDSDLKSEIQLVGVGIAEVGLTVSRVFNIKNHDISFGLTPKLQSISIYDYTHPLDGKQRDENGNVVTDVNGDPVEVDFESDNFTDSKKDYSTFNVDLGAAYQFGAEKQFQAGLVIKNLIGDDYESTNGQVVTISPMMRAGVSHRTSWTKVAFDLDITENDPVAFEDPTQYAAIGAELNVWRIVQLRAGYRANLAGSDQDIMTAGIGLSPGAVHLDIGVMANTSDIENEAGIALEFGVEF